MIKLENTEISGWKAAIRGMRNPMNSWDKSDTQFSENGHVIDIGFDDARLMKQLVQAGSDHSKFMRMINVTVDVTSPLYWWKEADTYKVGTVRNSCSTMHKITAKEFELDDFSHEHMTSHNRHLLEEIIADLNLYRNRYLTAKETDGMPKKKTGGGKLYSSYRAAITRGLHYNLIMRYSGTSTTAGKTISSMNGMISVAG